MAVTRKKNPFKPTAGMNPPELIGRNDILEEFGEALDNGPGAPDRLMRISGARGVGKTVMLNAIGKIAEERGFQVVNVAANEGFCERILLAIESSTQMKSFSVAPSVLGVSIGSVEIAKQTPALGKAMLAASKPNGLLITLDEIQDAPENEMRELGNEIQLLVRQEANVAFVFAGLPSAVDSVIGDKTLTFLQRAKHVELVRLIDHEVEESLEDTIKTSGKEASPKTVSMLTQAAAGYPFLVQLVGYYAWQTAERRGSAQISEEDAARGIQTARQSFDAMVIEPAIRRLPKRQLEYLLAMATAPTSPASSSDIAKAMRAQTKDVGTYRKRLIDANIIESAGYGKVSFAIPYMGDYLLTKQEDLIG